MCSGFDFIHNLSNEEKADMFDKIAENYYKTNFGSFSKSQTDLLMFSLYIDKLIDKKENFDDYTISKQLGIVQSTVRQLKKKKQLIYPKDDYVWYEVFLRCNVDNAEFDSGMVIINIQDPNVKDDLQYAIESLGGRVDYQLNAKLLKIPLHHYINLLIHIYSIDSNLTKAETENFKDKFIENLNEKYNKTNKLNEKITRKKIPDQIKEFGLELGLNVLSDMMSGANTVKNAIEKIIKNYLSK